MTNEPPTDPCISVIIHTRNSAATLSRALHSTAWAEERIVADMASTDGTRQQARKAGARLIDCPVCDCVDEVRNDIVLQAAHEWILALDSDEWLAADAGQAIRRLLREQGESRDVFGLPRFNEVAGQILRGSGWYPDYQFRLFRRGTLTWAEGNHRVPRANDERRTCLVPPEQGLHLHHLNYPDIPSLLERQLRYALTDRYATEPEAFDFFEYARDAYNEFARRHEFEKDGDLSTALATIMAWDRILRGLIHWDRLGRRHALKQAFTLPILLHEPSPAQQLEMEKLHGRATDAEAALRAVSARCAELEARFGFLDKIRWPGWLHALHRMINRAASPRT